MHPSICTVLVSTLSIDAATYQRYMLDKYPFNARQNYEWWSFNRIPMVSTQGELLTGTLGVIAAILLGIETMMVEQVSSE